MNNKFKGVEFMPIEQKDRINNQWRLFIKSNFQKKLFTKEVYNHLHGHCGFASHYNLDGFYDVYFTTEYNTRIFIKTFSDTIKGGYYNSDYEDINLAMIEELQGIELTSAASPTYSEQVLVLLKKMVVFKEDTLKMRPLVFEGSDDPIQDYNDMLYLLEMCEEAENLLQKIGVKNGTIK